ncbi:MAG TPA: hypothetical protein VIE64_07010 [Solirubrobacterales bacterium]|jgi:hypothetical protein
MSRVQSKAKKWSCDQCSVSVSRVDGEAISLPDNWASSAEGRFCLSCRRERAGDAALSATPGDSPVADRARLRRAGLIEFEIRRTPDHSDGAIAKACHTSASTVAQARRQLRLPHPPQSPASQRAKQREPAGR